MSGSSPDRPAASTESKPQPLCVRLDLKSSCEKLLENISLFVKGRISTDKAGVELCANVLREAGSWLAKVASRPALLKIGDRYGGTLKFFLDVFVQCWTQLTIDAPILFVMIASELEEEDIGNALVVMRNITNLHRNYPTDDYRFARTVTILGGMFPPHQPANSLQGGPLSASSLPNLSEPSSILVVSSQGVPTSEVDKVGEEYSSSESRSSSGPNVAYSSSPTMTSRLRRTSSSHENSAEEREEPDDATSAGDGGVDDFGARVIGDESIETIESDDADASSEVSEGDRSGRSTEQERTWADHLMNMTDKEIVATFQDAFDKIASSTPTRSHLHIVSQSSSYHGLFRHPDGSTLVDTKCEINLSSLEHHERFISMTNINRSPQSLAKLSYQLLHVLQPLFDSNQPPSEDVVGRLKSILTPFMGASFTLYKPDKDTSHCENVKLNFALLYAILNIHHYSQHFLIDCAVLSLLDGLLLLSQHNPAECPFVELLKETLATARATGPDASPPALFRPAQQARELLGRIVLGANFEAEQEWLISGASEIERCLKVIEEAGTMNSSLSAINFLEGRLGGTITGVRSRYKASGGVGGFKILLRALKKGDVDQVLTTNINKPDLKGLALSSMSDLFRSMVGIFD